MDGVEKLHCLFDIMMLSGVSLDEIDLYLSKFTGTGSPP